MTPICKTFRFLATTVAAFLIAIVAVGQSAGSNPPVDGSRAEDQPVAEDGEPLEIHTHRFPENGSEERDTLQLEYSYVLVNGKEVFHGRYRSWHTPGGSASMKGVSVECFYHMGKLHGRKIDTPSLDIRDARKFARTEVDYVDGRRHGISRSYFWNGRVAYEESYRRGMLHGATKSFDESGWMKSLSEHRNNRLHGVLKVFRSGILIHESHHEGGREHGISRKFFDNGLIRSERNYTDGEAHGIARTWDDQGILVRVEQWERGKMIKSTVYHSVPVDETDPPSPPDE